MSQVLEQLSEVIVKVEKLGSRYADVKQENELLLAQISELKLQNRQKDERILELVEKQNLIKMARALPTEESRKDVKLKINDMVREIDKCISLLNS
jgi:hypothetical protein